MTNRTAPQNNEPYTHVERGTIERPPHADLTDNELAMLAEREASFVTLYNRYIRQVARYCQTRIGNMQDAEDLSSSVMAKAFASWPPPGHPNIRAWLFTIAHHTIVDFYRHRGTRPVDVPFERTSEVSSLASPPRDQEQYEDLHAALATLTADQRRVIELHMVGMKGIEIATILGKSHAAIKMLQFRAIEHLRRELTVETPS